MEHVEYPSPAATLATMQGRARGVRGPMHAGARAYASLARARRRVRRSYVARSIRNVLQLGNNGPARDVAVCEGGHQLQ